MFGQANFAINKTIYKAIERGVQAVLVESELAYNQ